MNSSENRLLLKTGHCFQNGCDSFSKDSPQEKARPGIRRLIEYSESLAPAGVWPKAFSGGESMNLKRPHFTDPASALRPSQSGNLPNKDSDSFRLDKTDPGSRLAPRTFSHYELLEIMGEGQFGIVWPAKD